MTAVTLKLELTPSDLDMAFLLFQHAKQDRYSFDDINTLMRKIQEQGRPQLEALAIQKDTAAAIAQAKARKPKTKQVVEKPEELKQPEAVVDASIPDLSDLKLD